MQEDLGLDYVDRRNGEIEAVTMGDIKRVAKRLFEGQEPIVTIVGKPVGMAVPKLAAGAIGQAQADVQNRLASPRELSG